MNKFECVCVTCGKTFLAAKRTAQCCSQTCRNNKPQETSWDGDERPCVVLSCAKDGNAKACTQGCAEWRAWFIRRWRQIRLAAAIEREV